MCTGAAFYLMNTRRDVDLNSHKRHMQALSNPQSTSLPSMTLESMNRHPPMTMRNLIQHDFMNGHHLNARLQSSAPVRLPQNPMSMPLISHSLNLRDMSSLSMSSQGPVPLAPSMGRYDPVPIAPLETEQKSNLLPVTKPLHPRLSSPHVMANPMMARLNPATLQRKVIPSLQPQLGLQPHPQVSNALSVR